jgi:hypothetical protein
MEMGEIHQTLMGTDISRIGKGDRGQQKIDTKSNKSVGELFYQTTLPQKGSDPLKASRGI